MAASSLLANLSKISGFFLVAGAITLILGIVSAITKYPQTIVDTQYKRRIVVSLDSPTFGEWLEPTPPIYMKFYIFNVTNGLDIVQGKKAILKERGPYTYRMYVPRYDVGFFTNHTVAFRFNHTLVFQPDLSSGKEDDVIFHVNMPLVTVAAMMEAMDLPAKSTEIFARLVELVGEKNLVEPHTAREILFGYKDPFFNLLNDLLSIFGLHYDPTFGPFYKFNNSDDGLYLSNTGKVNYSLTNKIEKWNNAELLPYWTTDNANMINGTDGSLFRPLVEKEEARYIFFSDMCRSLRLVFEDVSEIKGVDTYRFHLANDLLANATVQPLNKGFCVPPGNCYDSGVINASPCRQGAPVLLSLPHFYNAAPMYQNGVEGLHPNRSLHDTVFDVEPRSGVVFSSRRSVQINIEVNRSQYIDQMKHLSYFVCPALWLGGVAEMDDKTASEFRTVRAIVNFASIASYLIITIGILTILCVLIILWRKDKNRNGAVRLNQSDDVD